MQRVQVCKAFTLALALAMLVVSGAASAQMVSHASHHAHHKAATHGTMVCVWMCAAGQVIAGSQLEVEASLGPIAIAWADWPDTPLVEFRASPSTRGPPAPIL